MPTTESTPTTAPAPLVCCPDCQSTELQELGLRYTWQPVVSLRRDGDAADYREFDYGDDVIVYGYACRSCGWEEGHDLSPEEIKRLGAGAERALKALAQVSA